MRKTVLFAAPMLLVAGSVLAQPSTPPAPAATPAAAPHRAAPHRAMSRGAQSADRPLDLGPNTPDANRAYQGGGVILEGAPGGPAPIPLPTPPGQTPRGMVSPVR